MQSDVSSFFLVGFLYDRFHERSIYHYSGLVTIMPIFAVMFFLITLTNFSFPGSLNFIGEVLVLFGLFEETAMLILFTLLLLLSAQYFLVIQETHLFIYHHNNIQHYHDSVGLSPTKTTRYLKELSQLLTV